jgi:hypothetical protein
MSTEWRGKNAKTLWVAQAKMPPDYRKEIRGIRFGDTASQNIKEAWGHKKLGVKSFTFEFQRIDDVSNLAYAQQQDLLQESDAQERRWLLALELHSYFIRKLLKKPSFSGSSIKLSSKIFSMAGLLSSDPAAERLSARRCVALPCERPGVEIRACRENSYR